MNRLKSVFSCISYDRVIISLCCAMLPKYCRNIVEILSEYCLNAFKYSLNAFKYSLNAAEILSECCVNVG